MPRTPGRPRQQMTAAPSRDALLACAFEEFAEKPYASVSLRALARKMDVSDTLFNHYFGSKDQLWKTVVDRYLNQGFQYVLAHLPELTAASCPFHDLQVHVAALLKLALDQPNLIRLVFNGLGETSLRAEHLRRHYLQPYLQRLDDQLTECQRLGLIRPISSSVIHTLILGLVNILIQPNLLAYHRNSGEVDSEQLLSELMDLFTHGVIPHGDDDMKTGSR